MLVFKNIYDKNKSIYVCDRCLTKMMQGDGNIYTIYVKKAGEKNSKKKWDLCKRDYILLCKGIEKNK